MGAWRRPLYLFYPQGYTVFTDTDINSENTRTLWFNAHMRLIFSGESESGPISFVGGREAQRLSLAVDYSKRAIAVQSAAPFERNPQLFLL